MNSHPPPDEQARIVTYAGQIIQQSSKVHFNVEQDFIVTTEDKIRLCLKDHLSRVEKRTSWIAPLGVLLTILVVFLTATFRTFIFSAQTWEAVFLICGILSFAWLVYSLYHARVSTSLDDVVADIKRTALERNTKRPA